MMIRLLLAMMLACLGVPCSCWTTTSRKASLPASWFNPPVVARHSIRLFQSSSNNESTEPVVTMESDETKASTDNTTSTTTTITEEKAIEEPTKPTSSSPAEQENLLFLQSLGAITGRGEFASAVQHDAAATVVQKLEQQQQETNNNNVEQLYGKWELVYSNTQLFRSSPFFMAGRAVCRTPDQAAQYNWFCDMHRKALAISTITAVRQIITRQNKMVSEFQVQVGAVPFLTDVIPFLSYSGGLPVAIQGAIVSTADYTLLNHDFELYMDTVEIKGSNIPFLRRILDMPSVQLESRKLAQQLERAVSSYQTPRPTFRTTYLSDKYRIGRDQDDHIFVYVKTSEDDTLTDYSSVEADLGVFGLLEGFNDAVTKLYL